MKKIKITSLRLMLFLVIFVVALISSASVFAFEGERNDIQKITSELFEDAKIKSYEHLYGFNDAPDFIYVEFENSGYAIYLRDTLELLEFAPKGNLPFPTNGARKYYGGPANYFNKESELLVNVVTRETLSLSAADSETYSEQVLELFSANGYKKEQDLYNEHNDIRDKSGGFGDDSHMPEDNDDLEDADLPGTAGTTYIPNYQYFFNNPSHGWNATGTCAAVAAQLLLSYNNYYNDRRIIDDRHLNGWNFTTNTVTIPANNPNHCTDPTSMTRQTLGSNGTTESDTNDTFFSHVVASIPASSSATDARNGLRNILNTRNNQIPGNISFNVDSHMAFFGLGTVNVNDVKNEIDAGRPMYLSLRAANNGGHAVVAYGYQEKGSTTGYITHFGWSSTYNRIWTNSAWCRGYVTLRINHTHDHNIDTGNIINNTHRELRCDVCGHRTVDNLYDTTNIGSNEIRIDSPRYPLSGNINIPTNLNDRTVTKIGDYAFEDNTTLTKVTIPLSISYIGDHAFSNCTNLSQVEISDETTSILGSTPFSGCIQLYNTVVSIRTDYHRIIDDTGRLIWMAHDFVYDDNHSSTHHDLICVTCGFEDTKSHNKHVVNGIEVCSTCPWVGGAHVHHEHTHSYIPIPHSGKFPINLHKAYCFCGEYIEEMCLGRIAEDGKAYCIHCGRDMTGALGQIINRILLPESDFHDNDIYCIGDGHSNDCCITKDGLFLSELKNVLYMDVKRRERSFYGGA